MDNTDSIQDLFYDESWADFGIKIQYHKYIKAKQVLVKIECYIYTITFKPYHQVIFSYDHGRDTYYHIVNELLKNLPDVTFQEIIKHFSFSYDVLNFDMFSHCTNIDEYHKVHDIIEEFEL